MTARLEPGDQAPAFSLTDDTGQTVSLADFAGRKVIVYFYPAAMTPGCTKQACDFSESHRDAATRRLRGGRHQPRTSRPSWRSSASATTSPSRCSSDEDLAVHTAYGAWGEKKLYGKTVEGVIRSTFVVDEEGKVSHAFYNVKATGHVAKLRRDLGIAA